jgi:hypothetical protein
LIPDDTLVHLYREPRSGKLMALELCTMPFIHGPSGSGGSGNPGFGPCGTCDGAVAETYCITDWGVCTGGDYGQPMMPSGPCEWTLEIPNPLGPGILYRLVFSLALQPQFYVWFEQTVPPRLLQYYTGSATNCMNPMVLNSVYFSEGPCNVSTITIEPCAGGGGGGGAAWLDTFTDSDGTDLIDHTPDSPLAGVYTAGTTSPIDIQSNRIIYAGSGAGDPASRYFDPGLTETVTIVEVCANRALADLVGKAVHFGVIVRGSTASNFCQNGYYCSLFINATAGPVLDALIIIYRYDAGTSSFVQSTAVTIDTTLVYSLRVTNSTTFVKLELLDVDGTTVLATLTETAGTYFGNTEIGLGFRPLFAPDANGDPFMDNLTVDQL